MSRTISLEELLSDETPELRERIRERGKELVKAETLRRLRALARKKQDESVGMNQQGVSRLEQRHDMLISSLNTYVRGLGGKLRIVAELPDIGDVDLEITSRGTVKGASASDAKAIAEASGRRAVVARRKPKSPSKAAKLPA